MQEYRFDGGRVVVEDAWTVAEVRRGVRALLDAFAERLPEDRDAGIVIKPNLNNDLVGLTGNATDLRVLEALLGALRERGYRDLTVADGSNVGIDRRGIDTFRRLRVDRLAARHGARTVNLNLDEGVAIPLHAGARPRVARTILDADFYISVPKIKTHAEAGFSSALKNQVGICVGQDKRHMHYDLGGNIAALGEVVVPDLVLTDALVGMEGNGPGDGEPVRLGWLMAADDPFVHDLVASRMVGLDPRGVPALARALAAGRVDEALVAAVEARVEARVRVEPPPPRSFLNRLASSPRTLAFKKLIRPVTDRPEVAALAHRFGVIQDVYSTEDDAVTGVRRLRTDCGDCTRCADFCPTGLPVDEIGVNLDPEACVGCLYCWFVCPEPGALELVGEPGFLARQIDRYKGALERL